MDPGSALKRQAKAILMIGPTTVEAVVDIGARTLTSWREVPGVQPDTAEELQMQDGIAKSSPEVLAALKRRGITDLTTVECLGLTRGYFAIAEEGRGASRRRSASIATASRTSGAGRSRASRSTSICTRRRCFGSSIPIVPVPAAPVDMHPEAVGPTRPALAPLDVAQPMGPGLRATARWGSVAVSRAARTPPRRGHLAREAHGRRS